jgi:2-amino-4-deoxychorismate synthase
VVLGPGPGDPGSADAKMVRVRELAAARLAARRPLLAVCLGHQVLAAELGLELHRRDSPYQGVARDIALFGAVRRVGFYSSFTALSPADRLSTPHGEVEIARAADGTVHALRGAGFAGVQFHPESVLSADGITVLTELLPPLLTRTVSPASMG